MKRHLITYFFLLSVSILLAQSKSDQGRWSLELAAGLNKPVRPMNLGYATSTPSLYVLDFGVRYMVFESTGLKLDYGHNKFSEREGSNPFSTKYNRISLQVVQDVGKILNFESWTNTLGLLAHAGLGYSELEKDKMGHIIAGITGQIKLSDRFALTGDFTTIFNKKQNLTFDGTGTNPRNPERFSGALLNGTIGITYFFGNRAGGSGNCYCQP